MQVHARVATAYAKINLTLEVLARRADGFHALRSVMVPIGLGDELVLEPSDAFRFTCDAPSLGNGNLVERALARIGKARAPFTVTLRKRVPVGAGLGGGSSDAAAVLKLAMSGALGDVDDRDWLADARALGSDVPFFLADAPALVEGTGERVTALGAAPPWWVVLLAPDTHVATGSAYGALAAAREHAPPPTRPRAGSATLRCGEALQRADYAGVLATMTNDFEPVVRAAVSRGRRRSARARRRRTRPGARCCPDRAAPASRCSTAKTRPARSRARLHRPSGSRTFVVPFAPGDTFGTRGARGAQRSEHRERFAEGEAT